MIVIKAAVVLAAVLLLGLIRRRLVRPFPRGDSHRFTVGVLLVPSGLFFLPVADTLGVLNGSVVYPAIALFIGAAEIPWPFRTR